MTSAAGQDSTNRQASPRRRGRSLATHLGLLCLALLVPTFGIEAFLLVRTAGEERMRHEAEARDVARRLAMRLDSGLAGTKAMLELLASHNTLHSGDFAAFYRRAGEVPLLPGGAIILRDGEGRQLLSTRTPWGQPLPRHPGTDADAVVLSADRTGFSDPFRVAADAAPAFAIVTPARDAGGRARLLSAELPVEGLAGLLWRDGLPSGMSGLVLDRHGALIIESAPNSAASLGSPLPPAVLSGLQAAGEGWVHAAGATGAPVLLAFARSELTDWISAVLVPEAVFAAPLRRSLLTAAAVGALLAALGVALAFVFARRIAGPIASLAGLAANGTTNALETPLREVNDVAHALALARDNARIREREREELLRTLDCAQVLVRTPEGRITLWTAGKRRLFGWTRSEALGRLSHELLATEFPRPLPEIEAELLAHGEWQGELRQRRRDGATVIVASHWALRRDAAGRPLAVVEACNDITALRAVEAELRRSRDLLASVVNGSADPISARDREGRYVILNPSAAALLGAPDQATRWNGAGAETPGITGPLDAADREVIESGMARTDEDEVTIEGESRVLLTTRAPWRDAEGHGLGVVAVSRDITPRRRAETQLRQMQSELFRADRLDAMGVMAAALAHELNQPLTAVANFAAAANRLLSLGAMPDPERLALAREAMAEAAAQAIHAGDIVRRLREFAGREEGERHLVNLNDLVREGVALVNASGREQEIELRLSLGQGLPPVLADRVQLQQVVVNLLRNAMEALHEAPRRAIDIATAALAEDRVEIRVADTGPGLAQEVMARLFEPFVSTKRGGMGLGLSISRSIVEAHGGALEAMPRPGGGTVFRVLLPAEPSRGAGGPHDG